uniref:Uncharacterized protein n=1 Tax=Oryza sativa subsp. japonica TaxID=39947 RepID=Q8LIL9_ORYSJ|nr:hypothetical protein [Oryza sativa Japonica Group]BAD31207.1 hypothetical protein [Oryza sativa Japonica Group]
MVHWWRNHLYSRLIPVFSPKSSGMHIPKSQIKIHATNHKIIHLSESQIEKKRERMLAVAAPCRRSPLATGAAPLAACCVWSRRPSDGKGGGGRGPGMGGGRGGEGRRRGGGEERRKGSI